MWAKSEEKSIKTGGYGLFKKKIPLPHFSKYRACYMQLIAFELANKTYTRFKTQD